MFCCCAVLYVMDTKTLLVIIIICASLYFMFRFQNVQTLNTSLQQENQTLKLVVPLFNNTKPTDPQEEPTHSPSMHPSEHKQPMLHDSDRPPMIGVETFDNAPLGHTAPLVERKGGPSVIPDQAFDQKPLPSYNQPYGIQASLIESQSDRSRVIPESIASNTNEPPIYTGETTNRAYV